MAQKYVLTGGPGSGKSSIILALERKGEAVIREVAEDYIKLRQASGTAEPWKDPKFQDSILEWQLAREKDADRIAKNGRIFLDRGVIDGVAYCQMQGTYLSMKCAARIMKMTKPYSQVFIIENIGHCKANDVRRESLAEALELERLQERNYWEAGYNPIRIPPAPLGERVNLILGHAYSEYYFKVVRSV